MRAPGAGERGRRDLATDDRGVSVTVNHVLAIAITTVLVAGLVTAVGGIVDSQERQATSDQLRVVGERLATEVAAVSRLAHDGGSVSVTVAHRTRVAGSPYDAAVRTGGDCPSTVTAVACVRVETDGTAVHVGVSNATPVALAERGPGRFALSATGAGGGPGSAEPVWEVPLRVGVTEDVGERVVPREAVNATGPPPVIDLLRFLPEMPTSTDNVTLVANASDLDGSVESYQWDVNGNGTFAYTGKNKTLPPMAPGVYPVTLRVIDDESKETTASKTLRVAGLLYNNDSEALDRDGDDVPGGLGFSLSNEHASTVTLTHVFVDPDDDSIDELDAGGTGTDEVVVDSDLGTSDTDTGSVTIHDGGRIVALDGPIDVSAGADATVYLSEFRTGVNMTQQTVTVAVRYRSNGETYTSRFEVSPDTEAGLTTLFQTGFEPTWIWNDLDRHDFTHDGNGDGDTVGGEGAGGSSAAWLRGDTGGDAALAVQPGDDVDTDRFDQLNLSYWVKEGDDGIGAGPNTTEELRVEYLADNGTWVEADVVNATGTPGNVTTRDVGITDPAAFHPGFRFRFRVEGADDGEWFVDEVALTGRETT